MNLKKLNELLKNRKKLEKAISNYEKKESFEKQKRVSQIKKG
jgi:hypothetical protein